MTVAAGSRVSVRRAQLQDRPQAYAWLAQSDLTPRVYGPFSPERAAPTPEQFAARYVNSFFDGTRPYSGRMFVIAVDDEEVGCIAHGPIDLLKDVVEVDIWLAGSQHGGRGFASQALAVLTEWLQASYGVNRFLARPSRRNVRALRALRRAGFREADAPAPQVIAKLRLRPGDWVDEALLFRVLPVPSSTLQRGGRANLRLRRQRVHPARRAGTDQHRRRGDRRDGVLRGSARLESGANQRVRSPGRASVAGWRFGADGDGRRGLRARGWTNGPDGRPRP